jgi:hypothetical protein
MATARNGMTQANRIGLASLAVFQANACEPEVRQNREFQSCFPKEELERTARFFRGLPQKYAQIHRVNRAGMLKLSGGSYLVAVFAAVGPQFRVFQVEDMRNVSLGGGDAPGVFAGQHIFYPFGEFEFYLFGDLFVFDDIHRDVGIDKAKNVKVDSNGVVNFNDVFAPHVFRSGVYHKGNGVTGFVQAKPVKNPDALSRPDMIDDDTVFDFRYIQHG